VQLALGSLLGTADELLADRALAGRILAVAGGAPALPIAGRDPRGAAGGHRRRFFRSIMRLAHGGTGSGEQ
jgi:hypothetical protein